MSISLKRIYDDASSSDGTRILVDRLWPRGVSKEEAQIDEWLKEVAPSNELREWFAHDVDKWSEFKKRYLKELDSHQDLLQELEQKVKKGHVTLLFGAKDEEHNNAVVLKEYLEKKLS